MTASTPTGRAPGGLGQYGLFAILVGIWGSSYFFTALALRAFHPLAVVSIRLAIATAVLTIVVHARGFRLPAGTLRHMAVLGAANIAIPFGLLTWAQVHVSSSLTTILSSTTPIFVFVFAGLVVRTETVTPLRVLGIAVSFAGVTFLVAGQGRVGAEHLGWPIVVVVSSAIFGLGNVYTRRFLQHVHPFAAARAQIAFGAAYLFPVALFSGSYPSEIPSGVSLLAIAELGILGSAVGYLLFFHFIKRWGSTAASYNTYLQPLVGLALGVFALAERPSAHTWYAMVIILAGLAVFALGTARTEVRAPRRPVTPGDRGP